MTHPQVQPDPAFGLLALYDDALPHVYGYLLARCGETGLAEDLTAQSFLAAVLQVPFSSGHLGAWRTDETRPPLGIRSSEGAAFLAIAAVRRPSRQAHGCGGPLR